VTAYPQLSLVSNGLALIFPLFLPGTMPMTLLVMRTTMLRSMTSMRSVSLTQMESQSSSTAPPHATSRSLVPTSRPTSSLVVSMDHTSSSHATMANPCTAVTRALPERIVSYGTFLFGRVSRSSLSYRANSGAINVPSLCSTIHDAVRSVLN